MWKLLFGRANAVELVDPPTKMARLARTSPTMAELPKAKPRFEQLVFLDFEGVLQPEGQATLTQLPLLVEWLATRPEVGLVLTTTWRSVRTTRRLVEDLGSAGSRVLGVTPLLGGSAGKHDEIEAWLLKHRYRGLWVILTATKVAYVRQCPLVVTEASIGLKPIHFDRLDAWLELNGKIC